MTLFDTQYEEYLREKKTHVGGSIFEVPMYKLVGAGSAANAFPSV